MREFDAALSRSFSLDRVGLGEMPVRWNAGERLGIEVLRRGGQLGIGVNLRTIAPNEQRVAGLSKLIDEGRRGPARTIHLDVAPVGFVDGRPVRRCKSNEWNEQQ